MTSRPYAGGVEFCYVGKDVDVASELIKEALEYELGLSYDSIPKKRSKPSMKYTEARKHVAILVPPGNKSSDVVTLLKSFCRKFNLIAVPVTNLTNCLNDNVPKTVIAYHFSEQQWKFFHRGFTPISLKDLSHRINIKDIKEFSEIETIAREIFLLRLRD